jgi:hypothetical protein
MKLSKILIFTFLLFSSKFSFAACTGGAGGTFQCTDEGEARSIVTTTDCPMPRISTYPDVIRHDQSFKNWYKKCEDGLQGNIIAYYQTSCSTRSGETVPGALVAGTLYCDRGCELITGGPAGQPPNQFSGFAPTGNSCTIGNGCPNGLTPSPTNPAICSPPNPDLDGDGVPNDQDAFPDDPTEQYDSDGDGVGNNGDLKPNDPNNGADNGTGNESDNRSSGGANCKTPPNSSGDAILSQIAYQTWATRCQAEKLTGSVSGDATNCNASYTCTGDSVQCTQVALLRKNACNTESTTSDPNAQPSWTNVTNPGISTTGDPTEVPNKTEFINLSVIDQSGILSNRSCPTLGTIEMGQFGSYSLDSYPWTCDILLITKAIIILMAAFTALRILMGDSDA